MDLTNRYTVTEKVQVLDPATKIWEDAIIMGFEGSHEIRVKYVNWSDKLAKRFGSDRIKVNRNAPESSWPVRKYIQTQDVRGPRRTKKPGTDSMDLRKRQFGDEVHFIGSTKQSPGDIPSLEDIRKELENSNQLQSAIVVMNDPFRKNMGITREDPQHPTDIEFIDYDQVRPKNWIPEIAPPEDPSSSDDEPPAQKVRKMETDPVPIANTIITNPPTPKFDIGSFLASLADKDEKLDFVPCRNGIVSPGDIVTANIKNTVFTMKAEQLWFDSEKKKALAKLVDGDDDSYSLTYPVVRLSLVEEKFLRNESLDMPEDCSPINKAFHYLSALKRLVAMSQCKKTILNHDLCLADDISRQLFLLGSTSNVKYHIDPSCTKFLKNSEWDALIGQQWDLRPPIAPKTFSHVIKSMKFSLNKDFLIKTVRVSMDCCEDDFNTDEEYRQSAANNCKSQFKF